MAYESGIPISVVSIKGEGCKIDTFIKLAEKTTGFVNKVAPEEIESKFSNILKDEVVGTKVEI